MSDQERDVARGMYGRALPVRPAPGGAAPRQCLRGHDLAIATATFGYHRGYRLTSVTCTVCFTLRDPRASWCVIDPADQHTTDNAPDHGLTLVRIPPPVRGGLGQLQLRIDDDPLADLDLAVCGPCRRAVLEHVRVDQPHRRRGLGRLLVAAALTLAPPSEYHWSTTRIADTPIARAFWAGISWPGTLGQPHPCTDMNRAAGRLPDW